MTDECRGEGRCCDRQDLKSLKKLLSLCPPCVDTGSWHDLTFATTIDAALNGVALYHDPANRLTPIIGPLTVVPSPWPKRSVQMAQFVSPLIATLLTKASMDKQWIYDSLDSGGVLESDQFIKRLATIMISTENKCPVELVLFRNDFMLHVPDNSNIRHPVYGHVPLKSVEQNTIAVGMSYLSDKVSKIHDNTMRRLKKAGHWDNIDLKGRRDEQIGCQTFARTIAKALKTCVELDTFNIYNNIGVCLMITEDTEKNCIDQLGVVQAIDEALDEEHLTNMLGLQRTIGYLLTAFREGKLYSEKDGTIVLEERNCLNGTKKKTICLVYWRMFYDPQQISGEDEEDLWKLRILFEGSNALKCPTIGAQLAGAKEIQKAFASRKNVERFLPVSYFDNRKEIREASIDIIMECTAKQLDPLHDEELLQKVIDYDKENWVLKPQREGGGHNYFSNDMVNKLKLLKETCVAGTSGFVLMELLRPPAHRCTVLDITKDSMKLRSFDADSELGIYCAYAGIRNAEEITSVETPELGPLAKLTIPGLISLQTGGNVLRTKPFDRKEGGIYKGFGWLDSTLLVDDEEWSPEDKEEEENTSEKK